MTMRRTASRWGWALVAMTVLMAAAACGGDDDGDMDDLAAETSSSTAATGSATRPPSVEASASASATATVTPSATPTATGTPTVDPAFTPTSTGDDDGDAATPAPSGPPPPAESGGVASAAPVVSLSLPSGGVTAASPVEVRDTTYQADGREVFEDPSGPQYIAWYARFGQPGQPGHNSLFAAHINYVRYGNGPFATLTSAQVGDTLTVALSTGEAVAYTVMSVTVVPLAQLDMNAVVYPALGGSTERVTLISCGGTFVPNASGVGGEYESRVILVAERQVV
jgi:hypothetical protein